MRSEDSKPRPLSPWGWAAWLLIAVIGMLGLLVMRFVRVEGQNEAMAETWNFATATVQSVTVHDAPRKRIGDIVELRILVSFEVGGNVYGTSRYSFSGDEAFSTRAQAEAAKPAVGSTLTIHYNPVNPSDAVINRDRFRIGREQSFTYWMAALGVGEGLWLVAAARRFRRRAGARSRRR